MMTPENGPDNEPDNEPGNRQGESREHSLRNKLAIVGLSGLLFTGAAVGLAGVASAQDSGSAVTNDSTDQQANDEEPFELNGEFDQAESDHIEYLDDFELSPEDEVLFEQYDQCLTENGIDIEAIEDGLDGEELTDEQLDQQWEALEADAEKAFEACDPILEDLSQEFHDLEEEWDFEQEWDDGEWTEADTIEDLDLSEEDETVLGRFDQCLTENGIEELEESIDETEELTDEQWEAIEAEVDRAFETCEPILDDLSEDAEALFEDCPDDEDYDDDEAEELESSGANA